MPNSRTFASEGHRARRLVWFVILLGLGAGGITLAAFGFSIHQARANQTTIQAVAADSDHFLAGVSNLLAQRQRRVLIMLSGRRPDSQASHSPATLAELRSIAGKAFRAQDTGQVFDDLLATLRSVNDCDERARQWLERYLALEALVAPADQRVGAKVAALRQRLDLVAGQERLQTALWLDKLRAAARNFDPQVIAALLQSARRSDLLSAAQKESSELILLIEKMEDATEIGQLADLKDNHFRPAFARLLLDMSRLDLPGLKPPGGQLVDELHSAVFGNGARNDDRRATVSGAEGFLPILWRRLELRREREELQRRELALMARAEDAKLWLSGLIRSRIQLLATTSTDGFEHAWLSTTIVASVCGLLFVVLSIKTADILRRQLLEIIAATNSARASEQRVRQVVNASLDAVITMDERGAISGWNARAETTLGWKADEAVGLPLADTVLCDKHRGDFSRRIREFLETGRESMLNQRIEARALHRDGREIPVDLAVVPLRSGEQFEFNVFLQDLTRRKQNEYAITKVLAESTSLKEAAPRILAETCAMHQWDFGALWLVDPRIGAIVCSDTWRNPAIVSDEFEISTRRCRFGLGYELPGQAWVDRQWICVPDLADDPRLCEARSAVRGQLCGAIAFPIVVGSDVLGVLEVFSSTPREANDEMLLTLSSVGSRLGHFIEREQAEQALRGAEAKSRGILDAIPDVVFQLGAANTIVDARVPAAESDVYRPQRMLGKRLVDVFPEKAAQALLSGIAIAAGTGDVQTVEYRLVDSRNKSRDYEARVSPMGASGCLVLARDVSDRKLLQCQLAQTQKLESIGQLAAGIAHEINTPIQYIGDNTRFLQDSFAGVSRLLNDYEELLGATKTAALTPERVAAAQATFEQADLSFLIQEIPAAIEQSLDGVDRVATIVRAMKTFSHPECTEKQLTDLNHCIENTLLVARNEWKYLADLVTDLDPQLPMVLCLAGEFNQVILNLVVNAAHAIGDVLARDPNSRGTIRISTRRDGEWVEIRVADTGGGIPEAIRGQIFDPFFTTKEVGRGTGQGLAIAYSVIVDKHGGTISFETEPGRGTTFVVRLPVANKPAKYELLEMEETGAGTQP